jgi:hypothetical protein
MGDVETLFVALDAALRAESSLRTRSVGVPPGRMIRRDGSG